MDPTDPTIEILKRIRDELHDGLSSMREDLVGITERMDRLERGQTEVDLRIATELVAIAGAVRETCDAYRKERAPSHRGDDHEPPPLGRGPARRRVIRREAPRAVHAALTAL